MNETTAPRIRINKILSEAGIASRRAAEKLIRSGSVMLNGRTVTEVGQTMLPGCDHLSVEGRRVRIPQKIKPRVFALYKPKNCITTLRDPQGRRTVKDFFPSESGRLFPVGRLDYDAEGLLLLTNDGELAQRLMHPRHKVWKSYFVKVKGHVSQKTLNMLHRGPVINKKKHSPVRIKPLHTVNDKMWLEVSLREGTNRQIKKMFLQEDFRVLKIKRFRIGSVNLGELNPGETRPLSSQEIEALYTESNS